MIKDSGTRRDFGGAVRDCAEGKGRFDLMPLDVMAGFMDNAFIGWLWQFQEVPDVGNLYKALDVYCTEAFKGNKTFMMMEVAKHMEEGCKKYGERNWQQGNGIPIDAYIDSAIRHYMKWLEGWTDEPHDRAVAWNIMCCIWTYTHKVIPDPIADEPIKEITIDNNKLDDFEIDFTTIDDLLSLEA